MRTSIRIAFFMLVCGCLPAFSNVESVNPARSFPSEENEAGMNGPGRMAAYSSLLEPGGIALVAFLTILLARQRRDIANAR